MRRFAIASIGLMGFALLNGSALAREGKFDPGRAAQAISELGFDPESQDPVKL